MMVQIDPREYQAEVDQAKANLEVAEAQVRSAQLQVGLTQQTTTYSSGGASAQKESDEADYTSAQRQLEQTATANLLQAQANVAAKQATNERIGLLPVNDSDTTNLAEKHGKFKERRDRALQVLAARDLDPPGFRAGPDVVQADGVVLTGGRQQSSVGRKLKMKDAFG